MIDNLRKNYEVNKYQDTQITYTVYKLNIYITCKIKMMVYSVNRDRVKWAREGCPRNGNHKTKIFSHNQQNECKGSCTIHKSHFNWGNRKH